MMKKLNDYKKALKKLEEVLVLPKDEITRDSAIMRFCFLYDLAWKMMKDYLRIQGIDCYSPRECIKGVFQAKLIDYDKLWLSMIDDRNNISHVYSESDANKVYSRLSDYLKLYMQLKVKIEESIKQLTKI